MFAPIKFRIGLGRGIYAVVTMCVVKSPGEATRIAGRKMLKRDTKVAVYTKAPGKTKGET